MAEIFKPIEDFTEVIPSGNEEIQVSRYRESNTI